MSLESSKLFFIGIAKCYFIRVPPGGFIEKNLYLTNGDIDFS